MNTTERFTTRAETYAKHRPAYPPGVINTLEAECNLTSTSIVADIASGTGIFTDLLLKRGCRVIAVEPNEAMRRAAVENLRGYTNLTTLAETAERTMLDDASVNLITVAQAFHWFEVAATRCEFKRILKPDGFVALIWNIRRTHGNAFLEAFEQLLQTFGTDYREVLSRADERRITELFGSTAAFAKRTFDYHQTHDLEGLRGRVRSMSFVPEETDARDDEMMRELEAIFNRYQTGGSVNIEYETQLYYGRLNGAE